MPFYETKAFSFSFSDLVKIIANIYSGLNRCAKNVQSLTESEEQGYKVATVSTSCYRGEIGGTECLSKLLKDAQLVSVRAV